MPSEATLPARAMRPAAVDADARGWLLAVGAAIVVVTAWRVLSLAFNRTDLFVDESQYWLWGQELAFGAYSKPPLVGWLIRGVTELTGSAAPFDVRLAAPLLHGIIAALMTAFAATLVTPAIAAFVGLGYLTMPAVVLGSTLITTDTPMILFLVTALLAWRWLALGKGGIGLAAVMGAAFGLGFLSKYSILYAVGALALTAFAFPQWRIAPRHAAIAAAVALAFAAPNIWWNAAHDFTTVRHIAESAEWKGPQANIGRAVRFVSEQFGVMGPILFAAYLAALAAPRRLIPDPAVRGCLLLSVPILVIVTAQALASKALANWAVAFVVTGSVPATYVLATYARPLLWTSLGIGAAATVALPIILAATTDLRMPNGTLALKRLLGRAEMSDRILAVAAREGITTIVADNRSILADLFYQARDKSVQIRALPRPGWPFHHYGLRYPLAAGSQPILYAALASHQVPCAGGQPQAVVAQWPAGRGWADGHTAIVVKTTADCWVGLKPERIDYGKR